MGIFRICPHCGAHLDPGELCDCKETAAHVLAHEDGKNEITGRDSFLILSAGKGAVNGESDKKRRDL